MFEMTRILCVTDLSPVSENAQSAAVRIAQRFGAHLTVLSCGEHFPYLSGEGFHENETLNVVDDNFSQNYLKKMKALETHTKAVFEGVFEKTHSHSVSENTTYEILLENDVAATIDFLHECHDSFDLVVTGQHKVNFLEKFLFSSPAKEIAKKIKLPTLLMPDDKIWYDWMPMGIAVGSTLNEASLHAEETAAYLASQLQLPLTLYHCVEPGVIQIETGIPLVFPVDYVPLESQTESKEILKHEDALMKLKHQLQEKFNLPEVNTVVEFGRVGHSLVSFLNSDITKNLLVVGSQGKNALVKFFLGSHTEDIEAECTTPLLIAQQRHKK